MSDSEFNHQLFLRQTLWEFSRARVETDLVFVCKVIYSVSRASRTNSHLETVVLQDQLRAHAHQAILSRFSVGQKLFSVFPFLHSQTGSSAVSSLVMLPDWTKSQVRFQKIISFYESKFFYYLG